MGIFCLRTIDATLCFWIVSLFFPKKHIDKKDYCRNYEHHLTNGCFELAEYTCDGISLYGRITRKQEQSKRQRLKSSQKQINTFTRQAMRTRHTFVGNDAIVHIHTASCM